MKLKDESKSLSTTCTRAPQRYRPRIVRVTLAVVTLAFPMAVPVGAQNTVYEAVFDRHEYFLTYSPSEGSCGRQNPPKITTETDITVGESLPCTSGANLSGSITLPRPGNFTGVVANSSFFQLSSPVDALLSAKVTLAAGGQDVYLFTISGGVCETTNSERGGLFANTSSTREISSSCSKSFLEITRLPFPGVHDGEVVITSFANVFVGVNQPIQDQGAGYSIRTYYRLIDRTPPPTPTPTATPGNVTGLEQKYIAAGTSIRITIRGENFAPDSQVEFAFNNGEVDSALSVSEIEVIGSTEIRALLTASPLIGTASRVLRVRSGGGVATFPDAISVFQAGLLLSQGAQTADSAARVANHATVIQAFVSAPTLDLRRGARPAGSSAGAGHPDGAASTAAAPNFDTGVRALLYVFNGDTQIPGSPFVPNPPRKPGFNTDLIFPGNSSTDDDFFFLRVRLNFFFGLEPSLSSYEAIGDGRHSFILAISPTFPVNPPARRPDLSKPALKANRDFIVVDTLAPQDFVTTRQFRVHVIVDPRLSTSHANETFNFHNRDFDYLAAAYPIDNSRAKLDIRRGLGATLDIDDLKPQAGEKRSWANKVLDRLEELIVNLNTDRPPEQQFDKIVLMLDSQGLAELTAPKADINGLGNRNGRACLYGGFSPPTLAHELGHTLGLRDTYKGAGGSRPNPIRPGDSDDDGNFVEHQTERLASIHSNYDFYPVVVASTIGNGQGLPGVRFRLISLMGGGLPDRWPDLVEWKYLFDKFRLSGGKNGTTKSVAGLAGTTPLEQVHVHGSIDVTDQVTVRSVRRAVLPASTAEPGDYALELLDGAGQVLSTTAFGVDFLVPHIGLVTEASFSVSTAYVPGANLVRIRKGGNVLFSQPISANAPNVQVFAPAGGESLDGPFTVSWDASDVDGDALTYSISYLRDDGTPELIADRLTTTSFQWNDPSLSGGSSAGRLVVRATDGVNESSATSGAFSVNRRGPDVMITLPQDGTAVPAGTPTVISGAGSDAEDGYLPAASLSFRSSIDGDLGSGGTVSPILTSGTHTITLRGTDSDGTAAETSITLVVAAAGSVPVVESASPLAARVGTAVTFNGRNFAGGGATVRFGQTVAPVLSVSASQIVVSVPAGLPLGEIQVFVTSGGLNAAPVLFDVIYGRPFLTGLTPDSGSPGTPVFLGGAEFATSTEGNTVRFGSATATVLGAGLDGLLVAVPAGLNPGGTNVTVTTSQGGSDPLPFTITAGPPATPVVLDSISPSSGPAGTIVTINGTGFSNSLNKNVVGFGGTAVTPVSVSGNSLQAIVPFGLSAGPINVTVSVNSYPSNPLPFTVSPNTTPTPPPNGCLPSPANLVAWWPGDGNANDIQNGNNGTLQGSATFAQGKVNQAFSLNPSISNGTGSDFVSFGNPAALKITGSLTVDAWINTNDFQQGALIEIVTKWGQNFTCGNPDADSFILGLDKPGATIRLVGIIHTSNPNQEPSVGGGIITPGQLTHVAMTYDAATGVFAIYVNGAVVNSSIVATGGICTSDLNVMIGSEDSFQGPSRRFSGLVDEVDIFDRALSAAEIQAIFSADGAGKCNGVIQPPGGDGVREVQNISTRVVVGTGENVGIGGFIVQGTGAKRVIVRAIGPSLANFGVTEALNDPTLELFNSSGGLIAFNDDWSSSEQKQDILDSTLPPANDSESTIVALLAPGNHTAVLRGYNDATGVALVEVYDLLQNAPSRLANISTRGFVGTGGSVLIGGFIVGKQAEFVVRAIGPSLTSAGIAGALGNPVLDLYNGQGDRFDTNDNWQDNPLSNQVSGLGLAPTDPLEAALIYVLPPGNYTAIVRGLDDTVGVGLIEVYNTTSSP